MQFQNIHTFTYQKILHTLFCLFLKSLKAFNVSLRETFDFLILSELRPSYFKTFQSLFGLFLFVASSTSK